jgi:hypothetical protein
VPTHPQRTNSTQSRATSSTLRTTLVCASAVPSVKMLRHLPLGLAAAAMLVAPAMTLAGTTPATPPAATTPTAGTAPATGAPAAVVKSVFRADRASSLPLGLVPDDATKAFNYPEEPIVLTWSAVPGAVNYKVEVSSNASFTDIDWSKETDQAQVAPDALLPDGGYYWRVTATDAAGVTGITSTPARFVKVWPAKVTGLKTTAVPGGPSATVVDQQPYMSWSPLPGASAYDIQVAAGDQFATPMTWGTNMLSPFFSPAGVTVLPDDSYQWRVRGRDLKDNPGPWSAPVAFTKQWYAAEAIFPDDDAVTGNLFFRWNPVPGAERYQIQITSQQYTFEGEPLKINKETTNTAFAPTLLEQTAKALGYGDLWWRVRPIVKGIYGGWSPERHFDYVAPVGLDTTTTLTQSLDSDTALTPHIEWTPVTGATLYRVDIATDQLFHNIVESELTTAQGWAPRLPLIDNQVGTGYYWRVVWGNGGQLNPQYMVSAGSVPVSQYKKQTRVTLGLANGTQVSEAPLMSWSPVHGAARFELQMSQDALFEKGDLGGQEADISTQWGLGTVAGSHKDKGRRLKDGTWYWRARAIDGGEEGQTWSPVGSFTLSSPRPTVTLPEDGGTVIGAPLMRWNSIPQTCGYEVEVSQSPSFEKSAQVATVQTAIVLSGKEITAPGRWYWRVRTNRCDEIKGQWTPTRSFKSVRPPDFGLNNVPTKTDFGSKTVVAGALSFGGSRVKNPTLILEKRVWPETDFRFFGTVKGDAQGRFAFRLKNTRTTAYRLRWEADPTHPEGQAPFAIRVQPRVAFSVGGRKVVRRGKVMVRGSVYPARVAYIQSKTSGGWETIRTLRLNKPRFAFQMKATLVPGQHRLRVLVPGDQRLATNTSKARALFVYDRFVVKAGKGK